MHTKPISTEVIASYEATLTSGFASSDVHGHDSLEGRATIDDISALQSPYEECLGQLVQLSKDIKETRIHTDNNGHSSSTGSLDFKIDDMVKFSENITDWIKKNSDAHKPLEPLKFAHHHCHALFRTVLYLSVPGKMLASKPSEILRDLERLKFEGVEFKEEYVVAFQKDFFANVNEDSVYNYNSIVEKLKDYHKSQFCHTKSSNKSYFYHNLVTIYQNNCKSLKQDDPMFHWALRKLHELFLPFFLLEKQKTVTRNDFVSLDLFYKTLEAANKDAAECAKKVSRIKKEKVSRIELSTNPNGFRNVLPPPSKQSVEPEIEFLIRFLEHNKISDAFEDLASRMATDGQVEEMSSPISRKLYGYHMKNKLYAAMCACSELATCFDQSDATKLYNDIYYFKYFVNAWPRENKDFSIRKVKVLITALEKCIKASVARIRRYNKSQ